MTERASGHCTKYEGKRGVRWGWVVEIARDGGKRSRKTRQGFGTKREAQADLNEVLHKLGKGTDPFPETTTFEVYARTWLERRRRDKLRPTTARRYACILRDDVFPVVGKMEPRKLRPIHVREVLDQMRSRGLSVSTRVQARAIFGTIMKSAMHDGLAEMNPVSLVEPPSQNEISVEKRVPSPDQVGALIAASKGDVWEVPILLSATTGARRSEVLGARWADVDLDAGVLRVTRGLHWIPIEGGKRELRFLDPKSDKARRSVPLLPVVAERLRQHRTEQLQRRMKAGSAWHDSDLVCDRGDGRAMDPDAMTKAFKRLARKAGLHPSTRLHDLRHAVITYLGQKGLHPKIVSTIAGHSDPAFTMRVYQRAWDEGVDEARMALGGVFGL